MVGDARGQRRLGLRQRVEIGMRAVQLARDTGALEVLPVAANAYGQAAAFGGEFARAALMVGEVDAAKEATRTRSRR